MPESFGARLRRRREEQKIDLVTIAAQTKISVSLLQSLEQDDVSHWPSGIFRRAFIRAYAHAIDLDPDAVVREFVEVHPEPAEVAAMALASAAAADGARISGGPSTRLRYLVDSAIGSFSRFRRSSALEDAAVADGRVSAPVESDLQAVPRPSHRPAAVETKKAVVANLPPRNEQAGPDLLAVAQLCTKLSRVETATEVQPLLREAVRILDAKGLIVWVWDAAAAVLRPALSYGYSRRVLAQLPEVRRDAANATAAAFRSAELCAIEGGDHTSGALVVPLLTTAGCAGVLAVELQHGDEQARSARAIVIILGALLAPLIDRARPAEVPVPASAGDVLLGWHDASL